MEKKKLLKILSTFILIPMSFSMLSGCSEQENKEISKTLMIYLCGSDLESKSGSASANIQEILNADIPDNLNVIIETGGSKKWHSYGISNDAISRYEVRSHELILVDKTPNTSMGYHKTLSDFISYGKNNYKADKYSLILWNHGGVSLNGVCFDSNFANDSLSLNDLEEAFSETIDTDNKFEFIGFDACLMGNIETAYVVSKYADNMIASEDVEPLGGWDYSNWLKSFAEDGEYSLLLNDYIEKCKEEKVKSATLTHLNFDNFEDIINRYKELIETMSHEKSLSEIVKAVKKSQAFGEVFYKDIASNLFDLGTIATNLGVKTLESSIKDACNHVSFGYDKKTTGLATFYPLYKIDKTIKQYDELPCEETYKSFLKENYSNTTSDQYVNFTNLGEISNDRFKAEISPESLKYINEVSFKLFGYKNIDGFLSAYCLGYDQDVNKLTDTILSPNLSQRWITFDNNFISLSAVDSNKNITCFETPVIRNKDTGTLSFEYDYDKKTFNLLGFEMNNGEVSSRAETLYDGDEITLLFDDRTLHDEQYLIPGNTIVYQKGKTNFAISELDMDFYSAYIEINDIFGNSKRSYSIVFRIIDGQLHLEQIIKDLDKDIIIAG